MTTTTNTTKTEVTERIKCGCGQVHVEDLRYDHRYTPMCCMTCGKALKLELLTHDHQREYFCPDHCCEHQWKESPHWASHCQACGMDELVSRRAENEALREQVEKLQDRLFMIDTGA